MPYEVYLTLGAWILIGIGLTAARVSSWHSSEAVYWRKVQLAVTLDPKLERHHLQVLLWCQHHPPSLWTKVWKGWQSPKVRYLDRPWLIPQQREGG